MTSSSSIPSWHEQTEQKTHGSDGSAGSQHFINYRDPHSENSNCFKSGTNICQTFCSLLVSEQTKSKSYSAEMSTRQSRESQRLVKMERDELTCFGVWMSVILCPSNRNLSVLAGTPWKNQTDMKWPPMLTSVDAVIQFQGVTCLWL